jgi:hypothetical protein
VLGNLNYKVVPVPVHNMKAYKRIRDIDPLFLKLKPDEGERSVSLLGRFTSEEEGRQYTLKAG